MADRVPLDFAPPVRRVRSLLLGITDDHLGLPTPCPGWSVGDLLDHLTGLSRAFTQAAQKRSGAPGTDDAPPPPSSANLSPQWRSRLPVVLEDLAIAWRAPSAWEGTARAGGVTLPATVMGTVAVNELTMHGWDLARATGQGYAADPRLLEPLIEFLSQGPREGTPGMFGPVVPIEDEADLLDQAVSLAGRDPRWRPTSAAH
ncbi:TIGR03086 family protein [Actinoplanes sp. ATCC 53533]|uniref:TIGR03086 family metal-binding protein n=1 Tax=Actinoplanes sp. ATCC 53533 TaxID=1288362 RepID=UPI000F7928B8|nr:TIGR03086 family metal-binding protein [Actinoplanes sp. ATCC 53533]RSM51657.1 TIGR03086 family protein [Actinoplanes sp. ATCC 53533]